MLTCIMYKLRRQATLAVPRPRSIFNYFCQKCLKYDQCIHHNILNDNYNFQMQVQNVQWTRLRFQIAAGHLEF